MAGCTTSKTTSGPTTLATTTTVGTSTTVPSASGATTTTTIDPFATPPLVVGLTDTPVSVSVNDTFQVALPGRPASEPTGGSWSLDQVPDPVQLLSGGSHGNDDGTRTQT